MVPHRVAEARAALARAKADPWWLPYQVHPPMGKSGAVEVTRQTIPEEDALLLNIEAQTANELRGVRYYPGTWTYLLLHGEVWMSDTPDEIADHVPFIRRAKGNVLVSGLGLGVVAQALLRNPEVKRLDVVEINPDVARLVAPSFQTDSRFHLHVADAFEWRPPPGVTYDWAWHDVWRDLGHRSFAEFVRIRAHYEDVAREQMCWGEPYLDEYLRVEACFAKGNVEARRKAVLEARALNDRRHAQATQREAPTGQ